MEPSRDKSQFLCQNRTQANDPFPFSSKSYLRPLYPVVLTQPNPVENVEFLYYYVWLLIPTQPSTAHIFNSQYRTGTQRKLLRYVYEYV